jgi:hypothetical protein
MQYKNIILTKHALARMGERSVTNDSIFRVIQSPDSVKGDRNGSKPVKFIRELNDRLYHVVAQWKKQEQAWLVVSVWVRGEDDRESFVVQLLMLPFKLLWWIVKKLFSK